MILDLQSQLDGKIFRSPEGVALTRGPMGLGLIVTRPFRAGEVIYRNESFTVPDTDHSYRVLVEIDGSVEEVRVTRTQSVKYGDGREFDIPGTFINHACNPTSRFVDLVADGGDEYYEQVALVDLAPGDPITIDYTLHDWDCDGHVFTCLCGSSECYGLVAGFKGLPRHVQDTMIHRILGETARMWHASR
ncbi:MAG: SET domain-containing protein [Candidatus Nanopelagicales bacterium]|nr:SET domain-containing protein [Candidatus Nanopelagicales bacterium]